MAKQEHLDILKQGVKAWNHWREEHPEIRPDLSATDLRGADLNRANLSCAEVREVSQRDRPDRPSACACLAQGLGDGLL